MSVTLPDIAYQQKLFDLVNYWRIHTPNAPAIIHQELTLDYAELATQIDLCARHLSAQGVGPGDVVALYAQPGLVFPVHLFAAARLGAIWLGLNTKYSPAELDYVLGNAQPKSIWLDATSLAHASPQVQEFFRTRENLWVCTALQVDQRSQLAIAPVGTAELTAEHVLQPLPSATLPSYFDMPPATPTALIYTSGTTGSPKGAVISQYALTKASIKQAELLNLEQPSIINNLPINHIGSIGDITTSMIAAGGCVVMQAKFDVPESFELIQKHRITLWGQIPTMFQLALAHESFAKADLSSLQCILFSGAPASIELIRQLRSICPRVLNAYGMSETVGSVLWVLDGNDDVLASTVGTPVASVEFRLANEQDQPVPEGDVGEIQIRSDYCFSYYWNNEAATTEAFTADGYLKTGDLGRQNPDGTVALAGRTKERFKSGGYNVYPREIEQTLNAHPAVLESIVVAVPDALYHEVGFAYIQPKPGSTVTVDALKEYCKERLANYKVPKYLEFIHQLPQLANGKINRQALREQALEQLTAAVE